jgi:DDE family transposase
MPTECSRDLFGFAPVAGREVVAAFDGGAITSDAGALLLGTTDRAIGMMERFAACFQSVEAQQEMHAVRFAPRHQIVAGEARIGAHQDANPGPAAANLGNDARHRLDRAVRRIQARAPQLGVQQMASAEHVKRQIAVAVVIAMEEPALLLAMHRIVGGVEIENDLARRPLMRLQEQINQQPLDGGSAARKAPQDAAADATGEAGEPASKGFDRPEQSSSRSIRDRRPSVPGSSRAT